MIRYQKDTMITYEIEGKFKILIHASNGDLKQIIDLRECQIWGSARSIEEFKESLWAEISSKIQNEIKSEKQKAFDLEQGNRLTQDRLDNILNEFG